MQPRPTMTTMSDEDASALALGALAWAVGEPARANRLLDLTGLAPADLRARASEPATLAAVIGFLESHEPDLIACADALEVKPERLLAAGRLLA